MRPFLLLSLSLATLLAAAPAGESSEFTDLHAHHHHSNRKKEKERKEKEHERERKERERREREHERKEHHSSHEHNGDHSGETHGDGWHATHDNGVAYATGQGSADCDGSGCWPRTYIIGAQKSGTTSMYTQMAHQGACGSGDKGTIKEGHFFDDTWRDGMSHDSYTSRYSATDKCKYNLFIDATPDYIRHWFAPQRMHDFIPADKAANVRMLLLLREPVSRDLSYYNHMLANHMTRGSRMTAGTGEKVCSGDYLSAAQASGSAPTFTQHATCEMAIWQQCASAAGGDASTAYVNCQNQKSDRGGETGRTYLSSGMYSAQLKRWTSYWARSQILVLQMEALLDNTASYMQVVYSFLGFPAHSPSKLLERNEKEYSFTVHSIDCTTKSQLQAIFAPWNEELYAMLSADKSEGKSPASEPAFPTFPDLVKCSDSAMRMPSMSESDKALAAELAAEEELIASPVPQSGLSTHAAALQPQ